VGVAVADPVAVECRVAWAPDATARVLLQLPDAYVLMYPADARRVAAMLLAVADAVDEIQP